MSGKVKKNKKPTIIGFAGFMKSGKTTAAKYVGVRMFSFATPIKEIAKEEFKWDGKKDEKGRRLLQVLGTEAGREYSPDIWINRTKEDILDYFRTCKITGTRKLVVIDDVRYPNEAQFIKDMGGLMIRMDRPGCKAGKHLSEIGLTRTLIDMTIVNEGTKRDLKAQVKGMLKYFQLYEANE